MSYEELIRVNSTYKALPPGDALDNGFRDVAHRRGPGFDELINLFNRNS